MVRKSASWLLVENWWNSLMASGKWPLFQRDSPSSLQGAAQTLGHLIRNAHASASCWPPSCEEKAPVQLLPGSSVLPTTCTAYVYKGSQHLFRQSGNLCSL